MATTTNTYEDARRAVEAHPLWYHTMEVAPGVVTPGWFDLRPIVDRMPWPDVRGKRCLDVGPYDGFLSFELERRGAAEVVAADIGDHTEWDWPVEMRAESSRLGELSGPVGAGFRLARELRGSRVERIEVSVYDLDPDEVGRFDVVVCGTLMLHLRDPIAALESIARVCSGLFLSAEQVRLGLSLAHRRAPVAHLNGIGDLCQWWVPNLAGHRRMLTAAGFQVLDESGPYAIPFGPAHPPRRRSAAGLARRALTRLVARSSGIPHSALLARPRSELYG